METPQFEQPQHNLSEQRLMMWEVDSPPRDKVEQLSQTGGQVSISVQALGSVVSHV